MLSTIVWSVASFLMNLVLNYPIKVDTHFNIIGISCFGVIHDASIAMSTIVRHATFISKVQCSSISNILTHDDLLLSSIITPWFFLVDVLAHECIFGIFSFSFVSFWDEAYCNCCSVASYTIYMFSHLLNLDSGLQVTCWKNVSKW